MPPMVSFTPDTYLNSGKIWAIDSSPNGLLYMATDKGLLEFDGLDWQLMKGSIGVNRSILVLSDSLIYTGSDLDFGVWLKKENTFVYTSLYPFKEEVQPGVEEFWAIHRLGDAILFISSQNIYALKEGQLIKIAAPTRFRGSFLLDEVLYLDDQVQGLFRLDNFSLQVLASFPFPEGFEMIGMYWSQDQLVIISKEKGLFYIEDKTFMPLDNELSRTLQTSKAFCFAMLENQQLAFGTVLKGLYVSNRNGEIIHHINRNKGLLSNTILALHEGRNGKLWMGMDYGLASVDFLSPLSTFYDFKGNYGTAQTALIHEDVFYLGTNQGLYYTSWEELDNDHEDFNFELIPDTEGQVWVLEKINGSLFMGHDKGLFIIDGKTPRLIDDKDGVWTIIPYEGFLLTGTYNGVSIYQSNQNSWQFLQKMEAILGSCQQLLQLNDGFLWVNIPKFGIVRTKLDETLVPLERLLFQAEKFSGEDPYLFWDEDQLKVITDQSFFAFNEELEDFEELVLDTQQKIMRGVAGKYYPPQKLNADFDFFSQFNGFLLRRNDGHTGGNELLIPLVLRRIEAFSNLEAMPIALGATIPYIKNNVRISWIVPNEDGIYYQYQQLPQESWTKWSQNSSAEFLSLPWGNYTFSIRASADGVHFQEITIPILIEAPWLFSSYAFLIYLLVFFGLLWGINQWKQRSLVRQKIKWQEQEQRALQEQAAKHQRTLEALEKKRLEEQNTDLGKQLKDKTVELAVKAKENEEKNRLLVLLREQIEKVLTGQKLTQVKWAEMKREIDTFLEVDDKIFELQMDELHQEFFKKLKNQFPSLSNHDLRLCAYLKIGLNSKEIAEILNILPSSSYISRSRLRKKLNLNGDQDLYDFLNAI